MRYANYADQIEKERGSRDSLSMHLNFTSDDFCRVIIPNGSGFKITERTWLPPVI